MVPANIPSFPPPLTVSLLVLQDFRKHFSVTHRRNGNDPIAHANSNIIFLSNVLFVCLYVIVASQEIASQCCGSAEVGDEADKSCNVL